jgi:hypothetical protein
MAIRETLMFWKKKPEKVPLPHLLLLPCPTSPQAHPYPNNPKRNQYHPREMLVSIELLS